MLLLEALNVLVLRHVGGSKSRLLRFMVEMREWQKRWRRKLAAKSSHPVLV
jgi:hypothetical protein